jgi:signal transduction histidine kinase
LVFNKFYRSNASLHREGNGLGLHIANGFTEAFGGAISITSPHSGGLGTQIAVKLPMSQVRLDRVVAWE